MKETVIQAEKSSFPFIYEGMVWVLYTALYKYSYYLGMGKLPRTYENFPHLQVMLYALAMTLYVIPFYRWLAPALLNRKKYGWLIVITLLWFLIIPKISNVCVSYIFMKSSTGVLHPFTPPGTPFTKSGQCICVALISRSF